MSAGTRAFRQRLSEFASDLPVPEHVGLEINRMFGRANGAEHRRENLIAVYERRDLALMCATASAAVCDAPLRMKVPFDLAT